MYSIEKTAYGLKLVFSGFIQKDEMQKWYDDVTQTITKMSSKLNILIDMRTLKPLPPDAQEIMVKGQAACKSAGMVRSCVILDNMTTTIQFKRLAKDSGIYAFERYIDASANPAWEQKAVKWLTDAIDPDVA